MMEKYKKALEEYEKMFEDSFPTMPFSGETPEKVVEIINECIKNKKDVYEMGFLELETDVLY